MMKVAQQLDRPITEIDFENQLKNVVLSGDKEQVEHFLDNNSEFYNTLYDKELVNITISGVRSAYYPEGNLCTALMIAAEHNFADIAELLIARGAVVGCVNEIGSSVASIAASAGSVDVLCLLLNNGVDANESTNIYGFHSRLLNHAVRHKHFEVTRLLISRGADIEISNALADAVATGSIQIIKLLLDHGADIYSQSAVQMLTESIDAFVPEPEVAEFLLNRADDICRYSTVCLKEAIREKSSKAIKLFIEHGGSLSEAMGHMDRNSQERYFQELVREQVHGLPPYLIIGMSYDLAAFAHVYNQMRNHIKTDPKVRELTHQQQNYLIVKILQSKFISSAYNKYLNKVFLATFTEECRIYKAILLAADRLHHSRQGLPSLPPLLWRTICEFASRYSFRVRDDHIEKYDHVLEQGKNIMALNPRVAAGIKVQKPQNKVCSLQMKVPLRHSARG